MNTTHILTLSILVICFLMPTRFLEAASVTVTVIYKDAEEQQYSVQNIKDTEVLLPIFTTQSLLLRASWTQADEQKNKELYVSLQDPAITLPGIVTPNSSINPGPLTVFSTRLPFLLGEKQLVFKTPTFSLWLQVDEDEK